MKARAVLVLALIGCQGKPDVAGEDPPVVATSAELDPALLRELLGESLRVEGDQIRADGMLIRLAFEPLIRQTGPVTVQLVQGQGYRLTGIADGSPLWLLGLRDGDVLTGVDKQGVLGREHELRSLYESRPSRAELTYMRGTEARTVTLRIAAGSAWPAREESKPELRSPDLRDPFAPTPQGSLAESVRCIADDGVALLGRCEVARKAVDELRGNIAALSRHARIVPAMEDGQAIGFRLYGIRPGSLPHLFGIKNGDLLAQVDDHSLTSPDQALAVLEALGKQTEFRVQIERKSKPLRLDIVIVDELSGPPLALEGAASSVPALRRPSPDLKDPFGGL